MGNLCVYLTPFASDYSGVCSALFDMDCLTVINDANCCTNHYVYQDEPRWAKRPRPTLSSQLRSTDAIMGNDERVVQCVLQAAEEIASDLIALVGTPVPSLTGMDMEGIACEIESVCGRPALGFPTTGFHYYDQGVFLAGRALIERFAGKRRPVKPRSINILGMVPLDYGDVGNDTDLVEALQRHGWEVNVNFFMDCRLRDVQKLSKAEVNLAVSAAGLRLAKLLKERYGTPYVASFPIGKEHFSDVCRQLEGQTPLACADSRAAGAGKILLIADQIIGNSLRNALFLAGCGAEIVVGSFFFMDPVLSKQGDMQIPSERRLMEHLRGTEYDLVICDPLVSYLPEIANGKHVDLVHPAISGKLHWADTPVYLSEEFIHQIRQKITASCAL